jgi:hypothetical protein
MKQKNPYFKVLEVLTVGFTISYIGSLPVGTLNLVACSFFNAGRLSDGILFLLGVIFVEMFLVFLIVRSVNLWNLGSKIKLVSGGSVIILLLGTAIYGNFAFQEFGSNIEKITIFKKINFGNPMLLGVTLSALNPFHIPFWLTWNKVLKRRETLTGGMINNSAYTVGIGLGTFTGILTFALIGARILKRFEINNQHLNNSIIACFIITIVILLLKLKRKY